MKNSEKCGWKSRSSKLQVFGETLGTWGVRNRKCTQVHDFLYDCIDTYVSCIHFELKQKQSAKFFTIGHFSTTFKS